MSNKKQMKLQKLNSNGITGNYFKKKGKLS